MGPFADDLFGAVVHQRRMPVFRGCFTAVAIFGAFVACRLPAGNNVHHIEAGTRLVSAQQLPESVGCEAGYCLCPPGQAVYAHGFNRSQEAGRIDQAHSEIHHLFAQVEPGVPAV